MTNIILALLFSAVFAQDQSKLDAFVKQILGPELPAQQLRYMALIEKLNSNHIRTRTTDKGEDLIKDPVTDPEIIEAVYQISLNRLGEAVKANNRPFFEDTIWRSRHLWIRTDTAPSYIKKRLSLSGYPPDAAMTLRDLVLGAAIYTDGPFAGLSELFGMALRLNPAFIVTIYELFETGFENRPEDRPKIKKLWQLLRMIAETEPSALKSLLEHVSSLRKGDILLARALLEYEKQDSGRTILELVYDAYTEIPKNRSKLRTTLLDAIDILLKFKAPSHLVSDIEVKGNAELLHKLMEGMIEINDPIAIRAIIGAVSAKEGNDYTIRDALKMTDAENRTILEQLYNRYKTTAQRKWRLRVALRTTIAHLSSIKAPVRKRGISADIRRIACSHKSENALVQLQLPFMQSNTQALQY